MLIYFDGNHTKPYRIVKEKGELEEILLSAHLEREGVRYFRSQKKDTCLQIDKTTRNKNRERTVLFVILCMR